MAERGSAPAVLVVDDDAVLLRVIRITFQHDGFEVVTAGNGLEGLAAMEAHAPFDAVVFDLRMPRMDGRQFYREMRTRGYSTPALVLSAFGPDRARRELNADDAVSKPFDPDELVERVQALIDAAKLAS